VAAEKAILLVVEPDQAELVLRIDLPIAAQVCVGLMVDVHHRSARLVRHCENPLVQIVTAIRAEEPPSVLHDWAAKPGGSVPGHVERRARRHWRALEHRLLYAGLSGGRQVVDSG